ncbi:hypothetical protein ANN_25611 [Periplaneta americana]|uniref:Uncharacterized protein n=1 Tax=Periplaneta americana TaxID=6978 RepID=A0ABQ8S1T2_PERAM|nr:hypothetical protein ANN_25611 [Periplaneta americana]
MSTNIAAARSVPGRSFQDQKCRHSGCSEVETLGHVLGYCPKGELLRNNRHHKVRSSIATTLRKAKWEVYEEVHCLAENGSTRRADIIAIDRRNQRNLILDPTVRFEEDDQQANNVNDEKKSIYNPCIPHFSERYKMNINTWEVKGLLFGARGTSFQLTETILLSLKFSNEDINKICLMTFFLPATELYPFGTMFEPPPLHEHERDITDLIHPVQPAPNPPKQAQLLRASWRPMTLRRAASAVSLLTHGSHHVNLEIVSRNREWSSHLECDVRGNY